MLSNETLLIEDLKNFLLDNSNYEKKEINKLENLLYYYVNIRKKFNENIVYKEIEECVEGKFFSLNKSLFKVKNKYAALNQFTNQKIFNRHPWIIRSAVSRLKVFKRQKMNKNLNHKHLINSLNDNGLIIIPNFLSQKLFDNLVKEIINIPFSLNKNDAFTIKYSNRLFKLINYFPSRFQFSASVLNDIVEIITKLGFNNSFLDCQKLIFLSSFWQKINIIYGSDDIQKDAHMDTFFPSLKFWYFPFDVSINKSFMYAQGSHKLSINRMKIEVEKIREMVNINTTDLLSKRVSLLNPKGSSSFQSALQGSLRFNNDDLNNIQCKLAPVPVNKNSLIIADVSGIHSRGHGAKSNEDPLRVGIHGNTRNIKVF